MIPNHLKPLSMRTFEIAIPEAFILGIGPKLDFFFKITVTYYVHGQRVGISEISAPWSSIQFVNFNAPGLEDYILAAAANHEAGETKAGYSLDQR